MQRLRLEKLAMLAMLLAAIALVPGCFDSRKYAAAMADYAGRPENKAMYFNTLSWSQHWIWSRASPEEAADIARNVCEQYAISLNTDPSHCTVLAINDHQFWDPRNTCIRCMAVQTAMTGLPTGLSGAQPLAAGDADVVACADTAEGAACQEADGQWYLVDGDLPSVALARSQNGVSLYRREAVRLDRQRRVSDRATHELSARWHREDLQNALERARADEREVTRLRDQQAQRVLRTHQMTGQVPMVFHPGAPGFVPNHVGAAQYREIRPPPRQPSCRQQAPRC